MLEAGDGIAALELARRHRFDAVVSDIRMPRMNGLELLAALVELDAKLPVVLISGSDEIADTRAARRLGAFDFVPKPLNPVRFLATVARAIEQRTGWAEAVLRDADRRRRNGTILVVDDYEEARGVLRDALEDAGHAVAEAANGQQALNWLVSHRDPDIGLITLDLMMPVMDGFKFLELLHNYVRLSTIPVLIISSQAQHVDPASHAAIIGRVKPPFRVNELLSLVNRCVAPAGAGVHC